MPEKANLTYLLNEY